VEDKFLQRLEIVKEQVELLLQVARLKGEVVECDKKKLPFQGCPSWPDGTPCAHCRGTGWVVSEKMYGK